MCLLPIRGLNKMKNYENIRTYFSVFLGNDADAYGDSYPEIVDSSIECFGGIDENLINEIDLFLADFPTNELAASQLNKITENRIGDCAEYPPDLIAFLSWLSAYMKQKRGEDKF